MSDTTTVPTQSQHVLKAIFLLIPSLFGIFSIYAGYYGREDILTLQGALLFMIRTVSLGIVLYYSYVLFRMLRDRRIMNYKSSYRVYASDLRMKPDYITAYPTAFEVLALILFAGSFVTFFHFLRFSIAPKLFLLFIPIVAFYIFNETRYLNKWKAREIENV